MNELKSQRIENHFDVIVSVYGYIEMGYVELYIVKGSILQSSFVSSYSSIHGASESEFYFSLYTFQSKGEKRLFEFWIMWLRYTHDYYISKSILT